MATEIIGFNNLKDESESGGLILNEQMINDKIDNLTEEDVDDDGILLNMSDLSNLAEAMALVKVGLERISEITQTDISEEAARDIVSALS
jgi:hypothetical protein